MPKVVCCLFVFRNLVTHFIDGSQESPCPFLITTTLCADSAAVEVVPVTVEEIAMASEGATVPGVQALVIDLVIVTAEWVAVVAAAGVHLMVPFVVKSDVVV